MVSDPSISAASDADRSGQSASPAAMEVATDNVLTLVAERYTVAKKKVAGRRFRVASATETYQETAAAELERTTLEITRVPVNQYVDAMPETRVEGDTTIMPIVEERLVTVKRLFVTEEVHLTRMKHQDTVQTPVVLRRQHAVIEILEAAK